MNTDEMKKLAEAATPGPWRLGTGCGAVVADTPVPEMGGSDAVEYYGGHLIGESIVQRNADFIAAANPTTVLELIAENDELLEVLKAVADEFAFGQLTQASLGAVYDKVRFTYAKYAQAKGGAA